MSEKDDKAEPERPKEQGGGDALTPSSPGSLQSSIPAEVVDALKSSKVDVNVLVVNVVQRAVTSQEAVKSVRDVLDLIKEFDAHDIETFQKRADAIISVKQRDPDEIDKRKNNQVRRWLKLSLSLLGTASLIGSAISIYLGAPAVLSGMLIALATVSLAVQGPLASGESVTTNDMVRMVNALKGLVRGPDTRRALPPDTSGNKKRRGSR